MIRLVTVPVLPFLILAPLATRAAEPIQLVRPGDGAMGCAALAAEINSLASADAPAAASDAAPKKKHFGGLLRAIGTAAPFIPGVGAAGALVAAGSSAVQMTAAQHATDAGVDSRALIQRALAGPSVAEQRKARLTALFEDKHC